MRLFATLIISLCSIIAMAQRFSFDNFLEAFAEEYAEQESFGEMIEELQALHENPLDVNTATPDQLRQIPFISEEQIDDIISYRLFNRGMRNLSELIGVASIDAQTRQWLMLFLRADQQVFEYHDTITVKRLLQNGKHELLTRLDVPLYYRAGYSYPPDQGGYLGPATSHRLQYRMTSMKHLSLGVQAKQDAGEPFRHNKGWDSYGFHFMLHNIRHMQTLVAGDYRLTFGEGLVMNNGFSIGKTPNLSSGIKARTGTDESRFLRGIATAWQWKGTTLTSWLSHRKLDATLNDNGDVSTIRNTGLHRTMSELNSKGNLQSTVAGADVTWRGRGFHVGATAYYQHYNRTLSPGNATYRRWYPRGRNFAVAGVHYGYAHPLFSFSGETAISSEHGGLASLNKLRWRASTRYSLTGSYRFYSYRYHSFYASALCENSEVQNESGAMLRLDAQPLDRLTVVMYADWFYNPWARYGMSRSSNGVELNSQADWQLDHNSSISLRYQLKRKETSDLMFTHHRLRIQWYRQCGLWQIRSQAQLHSMGATGVAINQTVRYETRDHQWRPSVALTWFHSTSYNSRLYITEPSLLRTFSMQMLYGHGLRMAATVRWQHNSGRWMAELKYGGTRYFDRNEQGSGMQLIQSAWKNDLIIQIRIKI